MAQLTWTDNARLNLKEAVEYIARSSAPAAAKFGDEVVALADDIFAAPMLGAEVPKYSAPAIRERLCGKHRVIYHTAGGDVAILMVWHGARRLPRTHF